MSNTFIGNIGEPTLKFSPNGKAVLEFSLAENHSKKQGNEWIEDGTTWRRVTIWEGRAEALSEVLKRGDRVIVVGAEKLREYETRDGGKGQSLEITAQHVGIIPKAQRTNQQPAQQQSNGWADTAWGAGNNNEPPW